MAERFAKVNEHEIRQLLDNTTKYRVCLYNNTIALVVYEFIYDSSSWYNWYIYIYIVPQRNKLEKKQSVDQLFRQE